MAKAEARKGFKEIIQMKNKFIGNITLRELIEICVRIKPHKSDTTYVYLSTYSKKTREILINHKKYKWEFDYYSRPIGEETTVPDNQIHVCYYSMVGRIEVIWRFSKQQQEVYGIQKQYYSLTFIRTKSGDLECIIDDTLDFELDLDQDLLVREDGECVTLEIDQAAIYNSDEHLLSDWD